MAPRPQALLHLPDWVVWWLVISGPIAAWDALGSLLRPWTLEGGPLFSIWAPYKLYGQVDLIYSTERWASGDRFCEAQSVCNLVEIALQFLAVSLWQRRNPAAVLVALVAQTMTFWKTVLYWLYDILGSFQSTGHNTWERAIFIYAIPNGLWIVVPFLVMITLSAQVLALINQTQPKAPQPKAE